MSEEAKVSGMNRKKLIMIVLAAVVLIAAGVVVWIFVLNKDSYRNIAVSEMNAVNTVISRDGEDFAAYEGMMLQSGDRVSVGSSTDADGYMFLKLDEDKYIMVEPDTVFSVYSTGSETDGSVNIAVETGGITNRIDNKLSADSSYEVTTPGATMAVRGTIFRIFVTCDKNGEYYTDVQVFEGKVYAELVDKDGNVLNENELTPEGRKTQIHQGVDIVEFVYQNQKIELEDIPTCVLEKIIELIEEKRIDNFLSEFTVEALENEIRNREAKDTDNGNQNNGNYELDDSGNEQDASPDNHGTTEQPPASPTDNPSPGQNDSPTSKPDAAHKPSSNKKDSDDTDNDVVITNRPPTPTPLPTETAAPTAGPSARPVTEPTASPAPTKVPQYKVSFYYNGKLWASQTVAAGSRAKEPSLAPSGASAWYSDKECTEKYDFDGKVISSDITIYAK